MILHGAFWLLMALGWHVHAQDITSIIDDTDPGITYSSGWTLFTDPVKGTNHLSRVAGATASYTFTGIAISVFGTQGSPIPNKTVSTYSIDGGAITTYSVPDSVTSEEDQVQFYASPSLSNGRHTLLITNIADQGWYWFDSLKVTVPGSSPSPLTTILTTSPEALFTSTALGELSSGNLGGSTASGTDASTVTTVTSTPSLPNGTSVGFSGAGLVPVITSGTTVFVTASSTPSAASDTTNVSSHSVITTGALVGIVLASTVIFALLAIGALGWLRKRRLRPSEGMKNSAPDPEKPFNRSKQPSESQLAQGHPVPYPVEAFPEVGPTPNSTGGMSEKPRVVALDLSESEWRTTSTTPNLMDGLSSIPPSRHLSSASKSSEGYILHTTRPATQTPLRRISISKLRLPLAPQAQTADATASFSPSIFSSTLSPASSSQPSQSPVSSSSQLAFLSQPPPNSDQLSFAGRRMRRQSADGGIRIAGGPPGEYTEDEDDFDDGATLPPAYGRY